MNANYVYTLRDRHHEKSSPSPILHLNARSSIEYELMWRLQVILFYIKCRRSEISPLLGVNGSDICKRLDYLVYSDKDE